MSHLLRLTFWSVALLAILGTIITFVPGAECGWFLLVAALSVAGFFIPTTRYQIAAAALLIFALKAFLTGIRAASDTASVRVQPQPLNGNATISDSLTCACKIRNGI